MNKHFMLLLKWSLLLLALLAAAFIGVLCGSVTLGAERILDALSGRDHTAAVILFELRLPRVAGAALAGAGLAAAGFLLQSITDNELCAPNIIGVNAGAGFGVMLINCFFPMLWRMAPAAAFLGAVLASFLVLSVSRLGGRYDQKSTIVLAGVALSSILNAGISFLSLKFPDVLSSYIAFSVGGFSGVSLRELGVPAVMIALGFCAALLLAPKISLLALGDEGAIALGVRVRQLRVLAVIVTSVLSAAAVSFAGLLGFVGLIVPHMVRRMIGECSLRMQLAFSALCGSVLVIVADTCGRTLFAPGELPAGLMMALVGAPFFLALLMKRRHTYD